MDAVASLSRMLDVEADPGCLQDALWREHSGRLLQYATFLAGPSDANDVVVEAFLRAAPRVVDGSVANPGAYLFRAVTNQVNSLRRSRARRWRRDLQAIRPVHADVADDFAEVRQAVADLITAQRTVVFLVYWEDRTESDIARLLGVTPSTVREHLLRARAHLRKALR